MYGVNSLLNHSLAYIQASIAYKYKTPNFLEVRFSRARYFILFEFCFLYSVSTLIKQSCLEYYSTAILTTCPSCNGRYALHGFRLGSDGRALSNRLSWHLNIQHKTEYISVRQQAFRFCWISLVNAHPSGPSLIREGAPMKLHWKYIIFT